MYSLFTFTSSFVIVAFFTEGTTAQYASQYVSFKPGYCNVCRDVPNENVNNPTKFRYLSNPSESFRMSGKDWSCGYLQETVQDVNPYSGAAGEGRWCGLAQTFAEESCTCAGPTIPSMSSYVKDLNPACDLCKGMDFDYVPTVNAGLTAQTGVAGNMNCLGLYNAMSQGVLTSTLCGAVTQNAGPVCCNLESIEDVIAIAPQQQQQQQQQTPQQPSCATATKICQTNNDCCPGLACKVKLLNAPKSCSSSRTRKRSSIARGGIGGAAGRTRSGN